MLLLIDEDTPFSVGHFLERRGHEVLFVKRIPAINGKNDPTVVRYANAVGAVVVTCNWSDFEALIARRPPEAPNRLRQVGLISFRCPQPRAQGRLEQVFDMVVSEYRRRVEERDGRLIMRIAADWVRVDR